MDEGPPQGRLIALDLVRGVAVLGILAVNIAGFAGPMAAVASPHVPGPGNWADEAWFAFALLVFEGKMRALFTMLFGASLLLFIGRKDAAGEHGEIVQFRRLGWLALFGYAHFILLWWGDILFSYALAGFAALAFRHLRPQVLGPAAVALFLTWHALAGIDAWPKVAREQAVLAGTASAQDRAIHAEETRADAERTEAELAGYRRSFAEQAAARFAAHPAGPLDTALATMGETLPLMLLGMALFRSGFFSGGWSTRAMLRLARGGIATGGALTAAFTGWAWRQHFPPELMIQALVWGLALPHLLMALGYAAALVPAAERIARSPIGARLVATGRMALSNYIGATLVMTALFQGWGLGLMSTVPPRWYAAFVLGGWAIMLDWSAPWLARFGQGPLESIWRHLARS